MHDYGEVRSGQPSVSILIYCRASLIESFSPKSTHKWIQINGIHGQETSNLCCFHTVVTMSIGGKCQEDCPMLSIASNRYGCIGIQWHPSPIGSMLKTYTVRYTYTSPVFLWPPLGQWGPIDMFDMSHCCTGNRTPCKSSLIKRTIVLHL